MPTGEMSKVAHEALARRKNGATGAQVVDLARQYTTRAIRKIVDLMDGNAGKITTMDKNGNVVEIDVEVPASVQAKCAEMLLERGYGKSPQAVFLKTDSPLQLGEGESAHLSVAEKIQLLLAAKTREGDAPIDLEASEQREVPTSGQTMEIVVSEQREEKLVEQVVQEEDAALAMI